MNKDIFVIIPCYNEAKVIKSTVLPVIEKGYSVIVVDDCSQDDTGNELNELPVYYLRHKVNLGQGAALQTGINFARRKAAAFFVTFDADGQHDINDVSAMCELLQEKNLDIIMGSRFLPGSKTNMNTRRMLFLKMACWMNYIFTGILLTDAHNGLRVFNKRAGEKFILKENRMAHASEILLQIKRHGLKFQEHPVHIRYTEYSRKKGQSLLNSVRIVFELFLNKIFDK